MTYQVSIVPSARKELIDLPNVIVRRIDQSIIKLTETPRPHGCVKLRGFNAYRLRVGNYRIIYEINDKLHQVKVSAIGHRREIYR